LPVISIKKHRLEIDKILKARMLGVTKTTFPKGLNTISPELHSGKGMKKEINNPEVIECIKCFYESG
jgi:hypothetical protein